MDRDKERRKKVNEMSKRIVDVLFKGEGQIPATELVTILGALVSVLGISVANSVKHDPHKLESMLSFTDEGVRIAARAQFETLGIKVPTTELKIGKSNKKSKWEV